MLVRDRLEGLGCPLGRLGRLGSLLQLTNDPGNILLGCCDRLLHRLFLDLLQLSLPFPQHCRLLGNFLVQPFRLLQELAGRSCLRLLLPPLILQSRNHLIDIGFWAGRHLLLRRCHNVGI